MAALIAGTALILPTTTAAADDVGVDFALVAGASISGTTTVNQDIPIAGSIYGTISLPAGALMDGWIAAYYAATGDYVVGVEPAANGEFLLELDPGTSYKILYAGFTGAANRWVWGGSSWGSATSITASSAGTDLGTSSLAAEGIIRGTLPGDPNLVGTDVCVDAIYSDYYYVGPTYCGRVGDPFTITNLPGGGYFLEFSDQSGNYSYYPHTPNFGDAVAMWALEGETTDIDHPVLSSMMRSTSTVDGGLAGTSIEVNPRLSGTAYIQYSRGGSWISFLGVPVVDGTAGWVTWTPSQTYDYRILFQGLVSDTFRIEVVPLEVYATPDRSSIDSGESFSVDVMTNDVGYCPRTAILQYFSGGRWNDYSTFLIESGEIGVTQTVTPSATYDYRVKIGAYYSDTFTITVVPPTVTAAADAASIPAGGTAGATATVDPVPGSGSAYLQYLSGSTWVEFASPIAVVAGQAHLTWTPSKTFTYRFRFGSSYSGQFTITVTPPTVTAVADSASIPGGGTAGATATVAPAPGSGSAYLQYLSGSTWVEFASPIAVVAGQAHLTWTPSRTFTYRFRFGSSYSGQFTITVTPPTVTASPDAPSIPGGGTAGATATVAPAPGSGSAYLQYLSGSTWVEFASPVAVVAGQAHLTWTPSKTFTYRFRFGTSYSDSFTITVAAPTVTGTADAASIPAGGTAGATATVAPAPSSGSAYLQYLSGSTWVEFAAPVAVVAGQAHLTWTPSKTFTYRFRFGTSYSDSFTITVAAPTVTGTADAASIPAGGTAGATATVAPAPSSGSAYLQYLSGSTWVEFAAPVAVVAGQAHLTWTPSRTFTYRFRFGSTYSATFTITVVPTA